MNKKLCKKNWAKLSLVSGLPCLIMLAALPGGRPAYATDPGVPAIYTLNADFDQGTLVNVNYNIPDQLQLNDTVEAFNFIWVAASGRGTVVKINTRTGAILGEYRSAPENRANNPSRTTVDSNGNVWTANRDESENNAGSVIKIGLKENNQCVDRNSNGVIDTSTVLGDIKPWPNASGVDNDGGVETAEDECILIYQRLPNAPNARHVSVDADNNVWVAGYPFIPTTFYKLDSAIGSIMASFDASTIGCGGYGGLIDGNHVLWSASISQYSLLRYDLDAGTGVCLYAPNSYGLGIDTAGNVWNALYGFNLIYKFDPAGIQSGSFGTGSESRGVVITPADNNVWVANSGDNTVTRLDNTGSLLATIPAGVTPTGVAVDGDGKVWVTNLSSSNVMRIDPASNTVDLTVDLGAGAGPYNYSDMTGSTLTTPPNTGAWTVVHDTKEDPEQVTVSWNGSTPGDSSLTVTRACSSDGITFGAEQAVNNGVASPVIDCSYVKVSVAFQRSTTTDGDENGVKDSPVLYDLTISTNEPPICTDAYPSTSLIWPPNHKFVPVQILGITDPDGDPITVTPKSVFQDEPVQGPSSGNTSPDAALDPLAVRAERNGDPKTPGNGRVYHISFTAGDGQGGSCTGTVKICVPHDQGQGNACVDEGPLVNSLAP